MGLRDWMQPFYSVPARRRRRYKAQSGEVYWMYMSRSGTQ